MESDNKKNLKRLSSSLDAGPLKKILKLTTNKGLLKLFSYEYLSKKLTTKLSISQIYTIYYMFVCTSLTKYTLK